MAILAGDTYYPIFLRFLIWVMSKVTSPKSKTHHSLLYLLHHPRRCFVLLFPSINTWYLLGAQAGLHIFLWVCWIILQVDFAPIWSMPPGPRIFSGLYQALGIHTGGFTIFKLSHIAPALRVVYAGTMYTSGIPIINSLRSTNVYEEKQLAVEPQGLNEMKLRSRSEWSYIRVSTESYRDMFSLRLGTRLILPRSARSISWAKWHPMPASFSSPFSSFAPSSVHLLRRLHLVSQSSILSSTLFLPLAMWASAPAFHTTISPSVALGVRRASAC